MQDQNYDVFGIENGSFEARIGDSLSKLYNFRDRIICYMHFLRGLRANSQAILAKEVYYLGKANSLSWSYHPGKVLQNRHPAAEFS
jgi:hypothetical protein